MGHVALAVTDLARSEAFYSGVLGMSVAGRMGERMTFFRVSADRFQDLALTEVGVDGRPRPTVGLDHVGFRIGNTLTELRAAQRHLQAHGIDVTGPIDHTWSVSLYLADPDGNGVELYVDQSEVWKSDPLFTPTAKPLDQ